MNRVKLAALAAASVLAASSAQAATFVWTGGNYVSGTTSPNPLTSPDVLSMQGGATKFFGVNFTNQSGTVDWQGGAIGLFNGATVTNAGLWRALGNDSLYNSTGGGTFVNSGIFRKESSANTTSIGTAFVNSGQIDAMTGTIEFNAAGQIFNAGTSFTGAGTSLISGNAAFNGTISSANLDFNGIDYTGTAAVLSGSADVLGGNFVGDWTIASGTTLNLLGGASKFIADDFVNNGSVVWDNGAIGLYSAADVVNNGTWLATGNGSLYNSTGGGTLTNNGVFRKNGGANTTSIGTAFVNNGQIDAVTGTIEFNGSGQVFNTGTSFTGAGTNLISGNAAFNGAISSANLDFNGIDYTGTAAVLSGSADVLGGNFVNDWTIAAGSSLNLIGGASKFIADDFVNNGSVTWDNGALGLYSAADVVNNGTWLATGNNPLYNSTGGGTFTNNGLFRKNGGANTTSIGTAFVNNGQIDAATGTIQFNGAGQVFNTGTSFTGAGTNLISSNATFNGAISSANLDFDGGDYTGTAAALSGTADFLSGNFVGDWTMTAGTTLNLLGGATKFIADSFTNNGTVNWSAGAIGLYSAATVTNAGTITVTGNDAMYQSTGGGTLVNTGLIQKTGGINTTDLAGSNLINTGTIDVQSGTIALPNNFVNDGTMAGSGTFSVSGTLTNNGTIAPGDGGTGIGTLALTGNYAQGAGGLFSVGFGPGGTVDLFNISGTAALNGSLGLNCLGCSVNVGDLFTILDSVGDLSGVFASSTATGFNAGFMYSVIYDTQLDRVQIRVDNAGQPPVTGGVPEPATWAMLLLGFGAMGSMLRRRKDRGPRLRFA